MNMEKKLSALAKVANILNSNNIVWATGGSFLLYVKNITNEFNDFDIIILENDIEKTKELFKEYSVSYPQTPSSQFRSKAFFECTFDEVDFDFIAGFTIVKDNTEHYFPLKQENIKDFTTIHNVTVPLQTVNEWKTYYTLMGKTNKVELIERSLMLDSVHAVNSS